MAPAPPDTCPLCGADLTGEPIPDACRDGYGTAAHYSGTIVIYDPFPVHTVRYRCPDCHCTWPREAQE